MIFHKILVPFDGSTCSTHAFKIALDLAKKYNSKLSVVTCLEIDFRAPWYGFDSRVANSIIKKQKDAIMKSLLKLEEASKKAHVIFDSKVIATKSIVKEIVDYSRSHKIELIVMGSHGRTGFDKLLLGSVANGVSQKVKCPVLIIK